MKPPIPAAGEGAVVLRGTLVPLETDVGKAFVADCARHTEGLLADDEVMIKWGITADNWAALADNGPLLQTVRAERERRVATGEAARDAAQRQFAKAPHILGSILSDEEISPRHRIEAARELRAVATAGAKDNAHRGEKFTITINLGAGDNTVLEFQKPTRLELDGDIS